MRVYLVRHGQTAWNAERRNQGHTDIPLDDDGLEQARRLADAFDERPFTRIFTSDLQRAWRTAQPLAEKHGISIEQRPDLRERCFGDWEGLPMERVAQNFIEQGLIAGVPREQVRPPRGESTQDVCERLDKVVKEIEQCREPVVVICHGGSGAVLLAKMLRGGLGVVPSFRFDNTGITTLGRRADGIYQLLGYNETTHLRQPALSGTVDGVPR